MNGAPHGPHFPGRAAIDGYGAGGFRFAGMSHRGSILILPSGIWAWPVGTPAEIDEASLSRPLAEAGQIDLFLIGAGHELCRLPEPLQWRLRDVGLRYEILPTAAAASTYNVLFAEGRRVAAALIATD